MKLKCITSFWLVASYWGMCLLCQMLTLFYCCVARSLCSHSRLFVFVYVYFHFALPESSQQHTTLTSLIPFGKSERERAGERRVNKISRQNKYAILCLSLSHILCVFRSFLIVLMMLLLLLLLFFSVRA